MNATGTAKFQPSGEKFPSTRKAIKERRRDEALARVRFLLAKHGGLTRDQLVAKLRSLACALPRTTLYDLMYPCIVRKEIVRVKVVGVEGTHKHGLGRPQTYFVLVTCIDKFKRSFRRCKVVVLD